MEDLVAEEILNENIKIGESIIADHDGKSETLFIKSKKKKKEDKKKDESKEDTNQENKKEAD